MIEILEKIRFDWNNSFALQQHCLSIVERQYELAELMASYESRFDSVYLSEKSASFSKANESETKARVRSLIGNDKTRYEYEFDALTNLGQLTTWRVSQLLDPSVEK